MEIENQFPKREWTPADLVDDVLLTGCERYDKRPHGLSIDTWLVCLLNERLEELRTSPEPVTLATLPVAIDESSSSDADLDDAAFWMRELLELDDDMSVDELLADEKNAELFEHLVTGDQRDHVNRVLRELPKFQRQALMLHDAYGFSLEEVTRALERDIEDVRADLVTGREKLRRTLATAC